MKIIKQNEYQGRLKEVYIIIHEDKEGNQGIFAEGCINADGKRKVAPELTPYRKELPALQKYVDELNATLGKELGQTLKIKKFITTHFIN